MSLNTVDRTTRPVPADVRPTEPAPRLDSANTAAQARELPTDAERMKSDGLVQPLLVAGSTNQDNLSLTNADRIRADGI